jgi:hypothetical protein
MARAGDEEAGFSVERALGELRIRAWGFWSSELAGEFNHAGRSEIQNGSKLTLVWLDVGHLKPMRDEGQRAWSHFFGLLLGTGIQSIKMIEPPPITKLQIMRLCRSVGISITTI